MNRRGRWARGVFLLAIAAGIGIPVQAQVSSNNVPADWLQSIGAVPTLMEAPLVVDLLGSAGFDSNIYGVSKNPVGSFVFEPGLHVGWQQEAWVEREQLNLDYTGLGLLYPSASSFNQLNHSLGLNFMVLPTSRLMIRFTDSAYYQTGLFGMTAPPSTSLTGPSVTPLSGNPSVALPVVHTFSDQTRLDLDYQLSPRGSLDVYGDVGVLRMFGDNEGVNAASFYDTYDRAMGLSYNYRLTRNIWIGPTVSVDRLSFAGPSHADVVSGLASASWTATAHWSLSGFTGLQHVQQDDNFSTELFGLTADFSSRQAGTHPEVGGDIERHWGRYRADLSGQRTVTDGGGLLTTTENTYEQAELTHSMGATSWTDWETSLLFSNGESNSLSPGLPDAMLRDQSLQLLLRRNLTDQLTLRVTEGWTRQRATNLPDFNSDNRNLFLVGVEWRLLGPAGGR